MEDERWRSTVASVETAERPHVRWDGAEFTIKFEPDPALIQRVRDLPGASWSRLSDAWRVESHAAPEVLEFVRATQATVDWSDDEMIRQAERVLEAVAASMAKDAPLVLDGLRGELLPFQRAGVAYCLDRLGWTEHDGLWYRTDEPEGGVLIADEMGLGKTVETIAVLHATQAYPAIIVCPAVAKGVWADHVRSWLPDIHPTELEGTTPYRPRGDVVILNYDILENWLPRLTSMGAQALVLDESHYAKNPAAQRTRSVVGLSLALPQDAVRLCVSGTPIINRPDELVTQLTILRRLDEFGGKRGFLDATRLKRGLPVVHRKLRERCYLRRLKADVWEDMPARQWAPIHVPGSPEGMREYRKAEASIVAYLAERAREAALESGATDAEARQAAWQKALRAQAAEHLVLIGELKRLAAVAKMPAARQWVRNFLTTEKKLIVFGEHRVIVNAMSDEFANGCRISGEDPTTSPKRKAAERRFQTVPNQKVIACSIAAAGVALTLTAASDALFIECAWAPAYMDQALDRAHRLTQKAESVTGWVLQCEDTIDMRIWAKIEEKRKIVGALADGIDPNVEGAKQSLDVGADIVIELAQMGLDRQRISA